MSCSQFRVRGFGFMPATLMLTTAWPYPALRKKCVILAVNFDTCTDHNVAVTWSQESVRDLGFIAATLMLTTTWPYPVLRTTCDVRDLGFIAAILMLTTTWLCLVLRGA
ncbi:hypothetical protein PAXINDRAFT_19920 [Paxillus involutus ATCC 200175]|uniref:Uncharacterized protein n=1 Tax=Paxillus involutus ATCC 200175 TaxID=664439 RepID=A0A0C9SVX3_PAXIN|nr:hypothetical protein PAXINDRAFT_19920 [Paxillus involutus ATCC 200175]